MRTQAALREKELIEALTTVRVDKRTTNIAMSIIITLLRDKPLRTIQGCDTAKDMWGKSQKWYANKPVINKLVLFNNLLNTKYQKEIDMGHHILMTESQFSQLVSMGAAVDELMRLSLSISFLNDQSKYKPLISFMHTLGQETTTWD